MLAPSAIVTGLIAGTIDAGCLYPPFTDQAKSQLGPELLSWPVQIHQDYYFVLVARSGSLREKPHVVGSLLRALLEAETVPPRSTPPSPAASSDRRSGCPPQEVADRWADLGVRVSLDEDLLTLMEDEARWIVSHGLADAEDLPNCFELVHFEPLERLKPEAVGVIH